MLAGALHFSCLLSTHVYTGRSKPPVRSELVHKTASERKSQYEADLYLRSRYQVGWSWFGSGPNPDL